MGMSMTGGRARVERTHSARSATKAPIVSFSHLRRVPRIGSASVAAAVAGILCGVGAPVYAQEAAEAAAPASNSALEEVVVTANASAGVRSWMPATTSSR